MHTIAQFEANPIPVPLLEPAEATLSEAFSTFVSAANVLERSYRDLQEELARLRLELQESHCDLDRSLRENERMGHWLSGIVESLPCGVIVLDEAGQPKLRNHEALKLFPAGNARSLKIFVDAIRQKPGREHEYEFPGPDGIRTFSIKRAPLTTLDERKKDSVVIVRETTEHRRMEKERE